MGGRPVGEPVRGETVRAVPHRSTYGTGLEAVLSTEVKLTTCAPVQNFLTLLCQAADEVQSQDALADAGSPGDYHAKAMLGGSCPLLIGLHNQVHNASVTLTHHEAVEQMRRQYGWQLRHRDKVATLVSLQHCLGKCQQP